MRSFASDNNSGVHPAIMQAMINANHDHCIGYGDDPYTDSARNMFRQLFGDQSEVFFVFNGTGANVLGIKTLIHSIHAVICTRHAHICVDECGAPENFTGCKLIAVDGHEGKLRIEDIEPHLHSFGFEHHSQPGMISISQVTELGTVYHPEEIKKLSTFAHHYGMKVHMDGARIANAAAALHTDVKELTLNAGIDVLSFGGTKNGMMYGEALVFFDKDLARQAKYFRKQAMQLASKMRFISAQFTAYLENGLWLKNAQHANEMAHLLAEKTAGINGVKITRPTAANGVFACIPKSWIKPLQEKYFFYVWDDLAGEVRWMTSFDTTRSDIEGFVEALKDVAAKF